MKLILLSILSLNLVAATLDTSKSSLKWTGAKVTGKHFGQISLTKDSTIAVKEGKITGGNFIVDMNSMNVQDLTGDWAKKFIGHVKSGDFFNVTKHPKATLKIKSVKGKTITADLTIKGKTNEVKFDYKKVDNVYSGKMTFDRTKFDMTYKSKNFFANLGDKVIYDDVTVDFKLVTK